MILKSMRGFLKDHAQTMRAIEAVPTSIACLTI